MNLIMRWLTPPVFAGDEEKTRHAGLINLIGIASLLILLVLVLISLFAGATPLRILIIDICVGGPALLLLLGWVRMGRVTLARFGLVIFGFVFITWITASIGTVREPTASLFVFWLLMTGLLFDLSGIVLGTIAASLAVMGLIGAENAGWLRQPFRGVGLTQWVTFTVVFAFTSGLSFYVMRKTRSALALAEQEIERRKRVETDLKDSEQRYRKLVEWTPLAFVVYREFTILFVNPAAVKMSGAESESELLGTSLLDWIHPESLRPILVRRADSQRLEHDIFMAPLEERLRRVDGVYVDVEIMIRTIEYDGQPARQVSLRDITERKAAAAALETARLKAESASQAKSRFLASASHDLRQPAHALGLFVARLAELPHDEQTRQLLTSVEASVRAMQDMLDGFFDIARLESGQTEIKRAAFPIDSIFGQLQQNFADATSAKGLRLRFRPSSAWVDSDPGLLGRILLNIVSNAVRYTPRGTVLVACRPTRDGKTLRIEVRDSGVGIAAQHHEDIFQEFFQVENPQRDRAQGLGVGLNIVQRACHLLNHPLMLRSAPGCGTCFTLIVPLAPRRVGGRFEEARELASKVHFKGLRVALIEDDELGRLGLASLLRSWGCSVSEFDGAQAACDHYRLDEPPELIISDFRLGGGMDGIEAVERLRALAGRPVAACLISGDTHANVRSRAQAAGLSLLQKPVRPAKLRSLVHHLVHNR
jgi:PAS domain S-box-containing protein